MYKLIFSLLVFLLYSCTLFSDWEPFQLGRTNYYREADHFLLKRYKKIFTKKFYTIHTISFDSIFFNKIFEKNQYFNKRLKYVNIKIEYCNIPYKSFYNKIKEKNKNSPIEALSSTDTYF